MKYFTEAEFGGWFDKVDEKLKVKLDSLREELGVPVHLSKNKIAVGREDNSNSWHNVRKHGKTYAVDGYIPEGITYKKFYQTCLKVGFTGIGLYTGWSGGKGFHVDTRLDREEGNPAKWSCVYKGGKNTYGDISNLIGTQEQK